MSWPVLAAEMVDKGKFETSQHSEDELTILLGDRSQALGEIGKWDLEVPLVLVATDYFPYTSSVKPEGNILWVNPHNETTFLDSLTEIGVIELHVAAAV